MFIRKSKVIEFECQISDLIGKIDKLESEIDEYKKIVDGHKLLYDEVEKMFNFLTKDGWKNKIKKNENKSKLQRLNKFI